MHVHEYMAYLSRNTDMCCSLDSDTERFVMEMEKREELAQKVTETRKIWSPFVALIASLNIFK